MSYAWLGNFTYMCNWRKAKVEVGIFIANNERPNGVRKDGGHREVHGKSLETRAGFPRTAIKPNNSRFRIWGRRISHCASVESIQALTFREAGVPLAQLGFWCFEGGVILSFPFVPGVKMDMSSFKNLCDDKCVRGIGLSWEFL